MIWVAVIFLLLITAGWIIWPFLRAKVTANGDSDAIISIYADQIEEVALDQKRGLISPTEAKAACTEIERRRSKAIGEMVGGFRIAHRAPVAAVASALVLAAVAMGGYIGIGNPAKPDMPLAERKQELLAARAAAGDMTSRIQLLIEQTREEPDDFESWWVLARSHAAVGDYASSAEAYRRALDLAPDNPGVQSAYAEAVTLANGNKVPKTAEIIFSQLARNHADPRALYYLALARAQRQDFEGALLDWAELAKSSNADAPWMALVRRDIANMARFLKREITAYLPDATAAEIALASGEALAPTQEPDDLRESLALNPGSFADWIALAEAEVANGDYPAAAEALQAGRRHFSAAPFVLQKFAEAERELGLDLTAPDVRGPSAADVAAAAEMSEADRTAMIEGMVDGLAVRLSEFPNDPDGWTMLIRSYRMMGRVDDAEAALARARDLFDGTPTMQQILSNL
ncbi:MAG: c-type cytochrome biogenesis protein CcmI [Aestuariivita sp.]|nr:c-type cytochrome biogenesis protein CcmI [Aestuariivita sp.]MCY4203566.1 c-type cytochrome biogenesis protein CcmI [Aestuariivita sp.]